MFWIFSRFSPLASSSWKTYEMRLHAFNFCLIFYLVFFYFFFFFFYSARLCSIPSFSFLWVSYWVVWGLRWSIWNCWMSVWSSLLSWVSETSRFLGFLGQCIRMDGDRSDFCRLLDQNKIYNLIHSSIAICTRSKSGFSANYYSIVVFRYRPQGWIILGN